MGEKIVVGPVNKGLKTDRTPFIIDNDSFPYLVNAYQWRGRVKRKRGTSLLGQLSRFVGTTDGSGNLTVTLSPLPITTGISKFVIGSDIFTDPGGASPVTLITNGAGAGTLNRTTGVLTITGSQATTSVIFYPGLPVMGLEDLVLSASQFPGTLGFDTRYSYNISTSYPYSIYDVGFYKNPTTATYTGYTQKTSWTPTSWFGQTYQQFWSTNYQGAFWATNGITEPFTTTNIGMQFRNILQVTMIVAGPPATARLTLDVTQSAHGLVKGDFLFLNEIPIATVTGINFQTCYVVSADPQNANFVDVEFPNATLGGAGGAIATGIAQYLTNQINKTNAGAAVNKNCIRWYDGDPTNGSSPSPSTSLGWVNFCPPLSSAAYSIGDLPAAQYYLVGAKMIVPFKDRLLFFGPVVQTSGGNDTTNNATQIYLQDTVIYSQNGTPYYTCSYTNTPNAALDTPFSASNVFHQILVPTNQTATSTAFMEDADGFGGFISAGIAQPINSVNNNEDVLLVGFSNKETRFVYTGNDISPFLFYIINSELGTTSTFSSITMDRGAITFGNFGIVLTSQVSSQRIDLEIPDQIFQINYTNNGAQRICSQRDYVNEWVYFTYPSNEVTYIYPNQTLQYNYRDNSWAIFNESYTTYGTFREVSGLTWAALGTIYGTWARWNTPWGSGSSTLLMPKVIAGNHQGFVVFRDQGTNEATSLYIQNFSSSTVTSPSHNLNNGDYIVISGCLGTIGSQVNGKVFSVELSTTDTFVLNPSITSGTYLGGGYITRMYVPSIQTKQFPVDWGMARKTRIGPQMYLFTKTAASQITLQIYLSMNANVPFNSGSIVPTQIPVPTNNSLVYSDILYTCPESTNIGLTPANINLQMPIATFDQDQIWHRMNTSLIGDTVQIGFTLSDTQMRDTNLVHQFAEIELHGFILDVSPSQWLS